MARMHVLTVNEQQAFDKSPLFDYRDYEKHFDLPKGLMDIAKGLRTPWYPNRFLPNMWRFQSH